MDLHQSVVFGDLAQLPPSKAREVKTADAIARMCAGADAVQFRRKWFVSAEFVLAEIPLHFVARPAFTQDTNKVLSMKACALESLAPIVVDVNKRGVGGAVMGFVPGVIVVDGKHRHAAVAAKGAVRIRAWVGAAAMHKLRELNSDHDMGSEELRGKLNELLREKYPTKGMSAPPGAWINEVYPFENYFVYSYEGDLYRQTFKYDANSFEVKLTGEPVLVRQAYVDVQAKGKLAGPLAAAAVLNACGQCPSEQAPGAGVGPRLPPSAGSRRSALAQHGAGRKGGSLPDAYFSSGRVSRIVTKYRKAVAGGHRPVIHSSAPPGGESMVKALKREGHDPSSAYAIAWWRHNQGQKKKKK